MAIGLKEMRTAEKAAQVTWNGEVVDFAYRPGEFTTELLETVSEEANAENVAGVAEMMVPLLVWWDVLDEEGNRLPTDLATLKRVPLDFLNKLNDAIGRDMRPPESAS